MATCPRCRKHFRTLEDEENMHDCSKCGYSPMDHYCDWCDVPCNCERKPCIGCPDCFNSGYEGPNND